MKLLKKLIETKEELEKARKTVDTCLLALDKEVATANNLLAKIDTAEKRGGVLLLSDLNEELIQKLASMTDDNVFVLFCTDGTRLEIHKEGLVNKKLLGRIS